MFLQPYIIGDRLNTASDHVRDAIRLRARRELTELALRQVANGASALDVCGAASGIHETAHLRYLFSFARIAGCAVSIDSRRPEVVRAIPALDKPTILNCFSGALGDTDEMLAAIRERSDAAGVVAVCYDAAGTVVTPDDRIGIAKRMAGQLTGAGVAIENVIFDPVAVPFSCGEDAERVTFETIRLLRSVFPRSGVLAAVSNYSYGMEHRRESERAFARRARAAGATVFLLNALDADLCRIALGSDRA